MKGKTIKLLSVLLVAIMIITSTTSVFAANFDDVTKNMNAHVDDIDSKKITTTGGGIMGILQVVGMVIAVIILIVIGIKYMMGSAQEKAEYKKTFIPYIVGAILIFAASALAGVVVNFANSIK